MTLHTKTVKMTFLVSTIVLKVLIFAQHLTFLSVVTNGEGMYSSTCSACHIFQMDGTQQSRFSFELKKFRCD